MILINNTNSQNPRKLWEMYFIFHKKNDAFIFSKIINEIKIDNLKNSCECIPVYMKGHSQVNCNHNFLRIK
jgi:hypothetical protein